MAGRPREFDRDNALKQARDVFWTHGYEGTALSDLVEALGIASARIYAAFGSKEALFREAVELYEAQEGSFAQRALAKEDGSAREAIERMLTDAAELYTRRGKPKGCMVVSAATNYSSGNESVMNWLAEHRQQRTASIAERIRQAVAGGELRADTDAEALGDFYAALLHGLSVQARDGVPRSRLLALIPPAMGVLAASARH
ncbi:TetR/AcrR family transcriptional regulator [Massilia sp. MB5]|uniref:TetR/AcrR family transcriptional regulator n=1 Tax=unclassified Massilia TaxID=2609279 RepID=UPI00067B16E6|nr:MULTISPECIES: TetR/AcrR family transcriptional regulator [unclassified Massilia]AKU24005.1 TetR family transcriptional regulator [Massilia sp. NR 4-1]UMR31036.1 TetR/AcrR family transcriptional regulator [Massilia sp. MB5]